MEKEYWFVIFSAILFGTIAVGGQFFVNLGLSLYELSLYSVLAIAILLLPLVLIKRKYLIKKKMLPFFFLFGLIGALLQLTQYFGLVLGVPVAVVVFLLYSQPVWTTIFGKLMLKEKITARKIIAVLIALIGIFVLAKPWGIKSVGSVIGVISALLAGIFLSLWVIFGRKSGISKQHYITTTFGWAGFSTIWLFLLYPVASFLIKESSVIRLSSNILSQYWFYFIIYAIIAGIMPHFLFYKGVKKIQASIAGIILLLEPISATILAIFLFSQQLAPNIIFGSVLILLSNYIIVSKNKRT